MLKYILSLFRPSFEKRTTSALSLFDKAINKLQAVNAEAELEAQENQALILKTADRNTALQQMITGNGNIAKKLKEIVNPE